MCGTRAYATGAKLALAPAFVRHRRLSSTPTPEQHPSKMHWLAVRRLSVNAFPKRPGANFIPLTPLAFIDRARHVFADGPAVVHCVEINQCVGCRR